MNHNYSFLAVAILAHLLLLAAPSYAQSDNNQFITITVPDRVIQEAITQVLPITLDQTADQLEGKITIVKITNFHTRNNRIFCHIDLLGEDLNLVTRLANNDIRLKLGSANVDFDCQADVKYDAGNQILYVTPRAEDIQAEEALKKGDIGKALLLFLNGREFPFELKNIQPIVSEAGSKIILVNMNIADIRATNGALQMFIAPKISTHPIQAK